MAIKERSDIRQMFLAVDRKLYNRINIKHKKFYGLTSRLKDSEGKVRSFSDLDRAINDGEFSFYDDRYNLIWYHRVDSVNFKSDKNAYGRGNNNLVAIANGVTVFWAKRESLTLQNERFFLYQPDLFHYIVAAINDEESYRVQRINFDTQAIENQEFNTQKLHKESFLLKVDFELFFLPNYCHDACQEWDCCPI